MTYPCTPGSLAPIDPFPPLLIGITGPIGAGKSTVASYLEQQYSFCVTAFAEPILDMLGAMVQHVDVDGAWLIEHDLKEQPMPVLGRSYRELARSLGEHWGRNHLGARWWVNIVDHKWRQARERGDNLVVTDVRYAGEAAWLRANGGHLVGVQRNGCQFDRRAHESELQASELQPAHHLTNSGSRSHLFDMVDLLIDGLRQPSATHP